MDSESLIALGCFGLASLITAASGALFGPSQWFATLKKPSWQPPNWLFAPIWTVLYSLIAVSGWLVWESAPAAVTMAPLAIYAVHLCLNAAWSFLFFGLRRPALALIDVTALWLSIVVLVVLFFDLSPAAALLLLPYLAWVSFAAILNFAIWRLNRTPPPGDTGDDGSIH